MTRHPSTLMPPEFWKVYNYLARIWWQTEYQAPEAEPWYRPALQLLEQRIAQATAESYRPVTFDLSPGVTIEFGTAIESPERDRARWDASEERCPR